MDHVAELLKGSGYHYEFIIHEAPLVSVREGADFFHIEAGQTAPSLIIKTERQFVKVIRSGDRGRLDMKKLAILLGCRRAQLASKAEAELIAGCTIGSIPLVGLTVPCVLDKTLFRYSFVYGGSGMPLRTLRLETKALKKLNDVIGMME